MVLRQSGPDLRPKIHNLRVVINRIPVPTEQLATIGSFLEYRKGGLRGPTLVLNLFFRNTRFATFRAIGEPHSLITAVPRTDCNG